MGSYRRMLVFIISAFWCNIVFSQSPLPVHGARADSLMAEGEVPGAIVEYSNICSNNPKDALAMYNLAIAFSIDNSIIRQFDSCFKYLNKAVELDTTINALTDPGFIAARDDPQWKVFEDRLITMLNLKYKNPYSDVEYAKALWKIMAHDQVFFNEINISVRKLGMRSSVTSALWKAKLILSEINQKELAQLLQEKGWPTIKNVGSDGVMAAYLVVQHADGKMQKKFLPDVRKSCEAGELPWERYALMFDRMCTSENIPQRYGTHTRYNQKTGKEELYPLEDPSNVDKRRKEIGMEPLADYLSRINISYTPPGK